MLKIKLFCSAGMSTSILVNKMRDAAKNRGLEVEISAHSETQMISQAEGIDVALLGPQIAYKISEAKKIFEPLNIPVEVIPMQDYGMMNGEKVLDFAINLKK